MSNRKKEARHFGDELASAVLEKGSILVVGLDPQLQYMPPHLVEIAVKKYGRSNKAMGWMFFQFNKAIIEVVHKLVPAVKPQMAFYEQYGHWGVLAFEKTKTYAREKGLLVITDAKRGDGGDTANAYADGHIGEVPFFGPTGDLLEFTRRESPLRVDCMTVNGYIGDDCVTRFVKPVQELGTGIFVVDKTSFKPTSRVEELETTSGLKVWQSVAHMVREWGKGTEGNSGYRSVGVVLGATMPNDASTMREILPNSWFLVPGYGSQGAGADDAVLSVNQYGLGSLVSTSRGATYAYQKGPFQTTSEDFAVAAYRSVLHSCGELDAALRRAGKSHL